MSRCEHMIAGTAPVLRCCLEVDRITQREYVTVFARDYSTVTASAASTARRILSGH